MLSLFRPTYLLLGYSGAKLLFPSPLYFAFKDGCYWLFSRKCTQETTRGLPFECAIVGRTHTNYNVRAFTHFSWALLWSKEIRFDVHTFTDDLYYRKVWSIFLFYFLNFLCSGFKVKLFHYIRHGSKDTVNLQRRATFWWRPSEDKQPHWRAKIFNT